MTHVLYCLNNASPSERRLMAASPLRPRPSRCLERCSTCFERPFLLVGGTLTLGESHRALLAGLEGGAP